MLGLANKAMALLEQIAGDIRQIREALQRERV
jgi:hypothetical protein